MSTERIKTQTRQDDETIALEVITPVVKKVVKEYGDQFPQHPMYQTINLSSVTSVVKAIMRRVNESVYMKN